MKKHPKLKSVTIHLFPSCLDFIVLCFLDLLISMLLIHVSLLINLHVL